MSKTRRASKPKKAAKAVSLADAPRVLARYEVASPARAGLFPGQDSLSADASLDPAVRRQLRERCRTQVENDPVAEGIVDTLANDQVGPGPMLQLLLPNDGDNDLVERVFQDWMGAIGLPEKLRVMRRARATDGESFGILINNDLVDHDVKLDLRLIEADQVTNPSAGLPDPSEVDGIEIDRTGNPRRYTILRRHPGDRITNPMEFDRYSASSVVHYFRQRRAGQHRGVPDIAPALLRFAYMQRFTLATIVAAETAASHAGVVRSDAPPDGAPEVDPMESIELDRGTWTTLPNGWDLTQIKAEHPATTFEMFRRCLIGDIARCVHMPLNVAILSSAGFNFSSGKLDHLVYHKAIGIDRRHMERVVLNRLLDAFLAEASLIDGLLPRSARGIGRIQREWLWPGMEAIDPRSESAATTENLRNGTSSLALECARRGHDWRAVAKQNVKEAAFLKSEMEAAGLTPTDMPPQRMNPQAQPQEAEGADSPADEPQEAEA